MPRQQKTGRGMYSTSVVIIIELLIWFWFLVSAQELLSRLSVRWCVCRAAGGGDGSSLNLCGASDVFSIRSLTQPTICSKNSPLGGHAGPLRPEPPTASCTASSQELAGTHTCTVHLHTDYNLSHATYHLFWPHNCYCNPSKSCQTNKTLHSWTETRPQHSFQLHTGRKIRSEVIKFSDVLPHIYSVPQEFNKDNILIALSGQSVWKMETTPMCIHQWWRPRLTVQTIQCATVNNQNIQNQFKLQ